MIVELILAAAGAGALLGARAAAGWVAVQRARRSASDGLAAFGDEGRHLAPLPLADRPSAAALHEMISAARRARESIVAGAERTYRRPSAPAEDLPRLKARIEAANVDFFANMRKVYVLKVRDLAAGQVASRFDDSFGITGYAKPRLSEMEQKVVDLLDQVGAIGLAEQGLELVPDLVRHFSETMADAAADGISDLVHAAATAFHVPGLLSGTRDAINEIQLLLDDQVSLGDSFRDGVVPGVARTIMLKVGLVLDGATGWASLGAFTVICTWLGRVVGQEMLKKRLAEQIAVVERSLGRIRDRQREALRAINAAIDKLERDHAAVAKTCPDIGDEPALSRFVADLQAAYAAGLAAAVDRTAAATGKALRGLGERTWLDRLLGIDRPGAIAARYRAAQREVDSRLAGVVHRFSLAAEDHAEAAVAFLQRHWIFDHEHTHKVLARLGSVRRRTSTGYGRSLSKWAAKCEALWSAGTQNIESATAHEHALTRSVVEAEQATIRDARLRIAVLRRRLRLEPESLAA